MKNKLANRTMTMLPVLAFRFFIFFGLRLEDEIRVDRAWFDNFTTELGCGRSPWPGQGTPKHRTLSGVRVHCWFEPAIRYMSAIVGPLSRNARCAFHSKTVIVPIPLT